MVRKVMLLAPENLCDILQAALNKKYRTLPCSDPAAGRELLHQVPDALILDMFLPGTDGLAFLRENAGMLPPVIIVLTRFFSDGLLQALAALNVSVVIRIPFPLDCLARYLAALL